MATPFSDNHRYGNYIGLFHYTINVKIMPMSLPKSRNL